MQFMQQLLVCYGIWQTGGTSHEVDATVNGTRILYLLHLYKPCKFIFFYSKSWSNIFSKSGDGWSVGSTGFGTSNSANDHAESIRSSIASALPSGWSVSRSNNVVTVLLLLLHQEMLTICL